MAICISKILTKKSVLFEPGHISNHRGGRAYFIIPCEYSFSSLYVIILRQLQPSKNDRTAPPLSTARPLLRPSYAAALYSPATHLPTHATAAPYRTTPPYRTAARRPSCVAARRPRPNYAGERTNAGRRIYN